jgi:Pvc16 N-terminal domain
MALPASSFSIAAERIARFVDQGFSDVSFEGKVRSVIDTPVATSKLSGATAHLINLFIYKAAPFGFQPGHNSGQRLLMRLYCLITAFGMKSDGDTEADLRLLGHVAQLFHDQPVILPAQPAPSTAYEISNVLLSPSMEELNHIWTTQGDTVPYRLSLAYEFSLVPIEPSRPFIQAPNPRSASIGVSPFDPHQPGVSFGGSYSVQALARLDKKPPESDPPVNWMPMFMLVDGSTLTSVVTLPALSASIKIAVAGPPRQKVQVETHWRAANGDSAGAVTATELTVNSHLIDAPAAQHDLGIAKPALATSAFLRCTPLATAGLAEPPYSNTLEVKFT